MLCYQDRTFCKAEHCKRYENECKNSFTAAKRMIDASPDPLDKELGIAVMDMSGVCRWFKEKKVTEDER